MFKSLYFFIALLVFMSGFAQNYHDVDNKVRNYPKFNDIEHLSIRIKNDFQEDEERVRAAFIWVTDNISYSKTLGDLFTPRPHLMYYSSHGKNYQIKKYRLKRLQKAFNTKKGVCYDYSLLLDFLYKSFNIESKVIYGLSKTDIKDKLEKQMVKNHSWNAVLLHGKWKLMDATWAAGHFTTSQNKFIKHYREHYFITPPLDFVKNHFPADKKWQLLKNPVEINTFFNAPIFFQKYFSSQVKLNQKTRGIINVFNDNKAELIFDELASKKEFFYSIDGENRIHRMKFIKRNNKYISKLKFNKNLKESSYLTVYAENKAILNFKLSINE